MDYEVFEMTILIIYVVFLSINAEGVKHEISTTSTGELSSRDTSDIYLLYTKLAAYAIYPEEERSVTFQVKACNDAFLLLSSARDLNSENFYELVFGGGGNTKIFLRRKYGSSNQKASESCVNCLKCIKYSNITVKWSEEGAITILKDSTVYVKWKDPNPLSVNGFGIMTGFSAKGAWIFEESKEGTHEIETPNSGYISSGSLKDVYVYYTKLATYGIHPTEARSITFQVKACNDAFMLLSSASDLNSENFYELVFGGGKNTKIYLRRKYGFGNDRAIEDCVSCLSCDEYNSFTVKWLSEGTITIMKNSTVYIQWKDPDPLPVNGIGILTGSGAVGFWIFGKEKMCPCSCNYKKNVEFWSKQNFKNYSRSDLEKMLEPKLEKIKQELRLNKHNLSLNRRKRTSAYDNRKSSKQIGIVGIVFLAFVIGLVVFIDITAIRRGIHHMRRLRPLNP